MGREGREERQGREGEGREGRGREGTPNILLHPSSSVLEICLVFILCSI